MNGILVAGLVALLILPGCFGKSGTTTTPATTAPTTTKASTTTGQTTTTAPPTSGPTTATSPPTTQPPTTGPTTGPPPNQPPSATLAASNSTGTAPFNITFVINGADPDGDALHYRLSFGDGTPAATGPSVPASVVHRFTIGGNFTVVLGVSDATHTVNATLVIRAVNATHGKTLSGDVQADCAVKCGACTPAGCSPFAPGALGCGGFNAGETGLECLFWAVGDAAEKPFKATSTGGDPAADFWDTCDVSKGSSIGFGGHSGTIPLGTGCIVVWEQKSVAPGGKSTITFTYG
ncbi:MAG: hypothetical protein QOG31_1267 [Thermoplasmata archaeon]|jgi:hypothetical protein|nr:hypothetical protein [Thermoplasmata archaeon]